MAVAVGVGEGFAGGVLRGLRSGVVRCGLARVLVGAPRLDGGCAGRHFGTFLAFFRWLYTTNNSKQGLNSIYKWTN